MSSIREQLTAHGLERIADQIEAAAKPSLLLVSGEESTAPVSRLGGEPNLPEDIEWPTWRGRSLAFVAQLDLGALPPLQGLPLPASGSLYFFYEGGIDALGLSAGDRGCAQVLYSNGKLSQQPLRTVPADVGEEVRFRGVALDSHILEDSVPDCEDLALETLGLNVEERDRYFDFVMARLETRAELHRVGGFPEAIQGDPKLEAQIVTHDFALDPEGFRRAKEAGLFADALNWELLLQVDSDDNAGMMWGDVGRIYFLIRKEDLAARAFDKIWLVFQCS